MVDAPNEFVILRYAHDHSFVQLTLSRLLMSHFGFC